MRDFILKQLYLLIIGILLCLLFRTLPTASAQELTAAELEMDHALTSEVRTPHIQWGKPYAQSKTRVLIFVGGRGTIFREAVELLQRFDFEAEAIIYSRIVDTSQDDWNGGKEGVRRIERLLGLDWDTYLFLGVAPAKLPGSLQKKLVDQVLAGRGAVLSGSDSPSLTPAASARKEIIPFLAEIAGAKPFTLGKGRVVRLPARPTIEYAEGWQNAYETWQEGLGRALLWAAGKEPRSHLALAVSRPNFARNKPEKVTIRWEDVNPSERKASLQLWLRGPVAWTAPWPDREVAGNETLELPVPHLPAGRYHLDARIVDSLGVETWATTTFEVTTQHNIGALDLTNDWGEVGGKISGQVVLTGPVTPGLRVRIELLDKNRRILLRREVPANDERINFSFPVLSWLPVLVTVEASVVESGEVTASAYRYFHRTERYRDRFNFLIWDRPGGTLSPYAQEMLSRTGVTLQLAQGNPPTDAAANGIAWVPYTTDITAKRDSKGVMMPFCWNDITAVEKNTQKIADQHLPSRQHGVFIYSLGDEIATQGACLAETCMEAYRGYLREAYGTLAALNRSWGTHFINWAAVGLATPGDNEEKSSFDVRNYPRWFDRQAFKSWNFVQYAMRYAEAYRTMDPQAKTGFEGAGRFDRGNDIDLIVRSLGFWTPYPGTADEVVRSIAPRAFPRANWMGYTKDADSLLQKYWRMVTRGMDGVWWWRWECIGRFNGWLAPDLRPYPAVQEILADTSPVREGLGDLLLKSRMQDDGIALLYSYPSTFAHKIEGGNSFGEYEKSHVAWHSAIRDLGLQFSYVTDRMLRLGEFKAKHFRVLVLPKAEAIGKQEAEVIRDFVKRGGTVIADARPGIYDDHCKQRNDGILDDLFGVKRKAFLPAQKVAGPMGAVVDPGVEVTAGAEGSSFSLAEGKPVLIGRKVGKGYALLINGNLNTLAVQGKDIVAALGTILERAGVRPTISLRKEDGNPTRDVELVRWKNGGNEIIALFRQGGKIEPVTVILPKPARAYDLRNRKDLGRLKSFKTEIRPNRASFFVLTSEPATQVQVKIDAEELGTDARSEKPITDSLGKGTYAPGMLVKVRLSVPGAQGDHAVLVTARFPKSIEKPPTSGVFFPRTGYPALPVEFQAGLSVKAEKKSEKEGTVPIVYPGIDPERGEFLKHVVILGREPVTVDVPIAFNDPTGTYELTVTDLFTQKTLTQTWSVQ
jgi:hypothetical protein